MLQAIPKGERLIAFGDLHLHWPAAQLILGYARAEGINNALNLGDEGAKLYPLESGDEIDYLRLYHELRLFRDESPKRVLVCVLGDKTGWVPKDLYTNYADVTAEGKITGPSIYHHDNIIAVHHGKVLEEKHKKLVDDHKGYEPLVIFHGSSHSMSVLPKYKWLNDNEFVYWLERGVEKYQLKPGKVYWVNPGGNFIMDDKGRMTANMAIYDPINQEIILQTIPYDLNRIKSSLK